MIVVDENDPVGGAYIQNTCACVCMRVRFNLLVAREIRTNEHFACKCHIQRLILEWIIVFHFSLLLLFDFFIK